MSSFQTYKLYLRLYWRKTVHLSLCWLNLLFPVGLLVAVYFSISDPRAGFDPLSGSVLVDILWYTVPVAVLILLWLFIILLAVAIDAFFDEWRLALPLVALLMIVCHCALIWGFACWCTDLEIGRRWALILSAGSLSLLHILLSLTTTRGWG